MTRLEVYGADAVQQGLGMRKALEAVACALYGKRVGRQAWSLVYADLDEQGANMDIRSGSLPEAGLFGLKLISEVPANAAAGFPVFHGLIMACDAATGRLRALVSAMPITRLRTGAAAAVGARALMRNDARTLLVVGSGAQCAGVVAAVLAACPGIERVLLWNPRSAERAATRLPGIAAAVEGLLASRCGEAPLRAGASYTIEVQSSGRAAFAQADVVVTATGSRAPIVDASWVRPGTHISCIGADMPGKQELDPALLRRARVFADDRVRACETGELGVPVATGAFDPAQVVAEIGEVLRGEAPGRTAPEDITVFASCGMALLDLALVQVLFARGGARAASAVDL